MYPSGLIFQLVSTFEATLLDQDEGGCKEIGGGRCARRKRGSRSEELGCESIVTQLKDPVRSFDDWRRVTRDERETLMRPGSLSLYEPGVKNKALKVLG